MTSYLNEKGEESIYKTGNTKQTNEEEQALPFTVFIPRPIHTLGQ